MGFLHSSSRVRIVSNDLRRILPEMSNLCLKGHPLVRILNFFKIDAMLIGEWVEDVHAFHCLFPALFVPVDQVDPLVQALRYCATLKFLPQSGHKDKGVLFAPIRQKDIVHRYLFLSKAVFVVVLVYEHLREGVYLGNQLPDISGTADGVIPRPAVTVEDPISAVESAALKGKCTDAVRSDTYEIVEDDGRGGIMSAVVVFIEEFLIIVLCVFFKEVADTFRIAVTAHVLAEISKLALV